MIGEYPTKLLKHIVNTISSYDDFKMRLKLNGIDMYEMGVLKSVAQKMFSLKFRNKFLEDLNIHIDEINPDDYIPGLVAKHIGTYEFKLSQLDASLVKIWMKKHFGIEI